MKTQQEKKYHFIFSELTRKKIEAYQQDLINQEKTAGARLAKILKNKNLEELSTEEFVECLVHTKRTTISAEFTQFDPEVNWNEDEIAILGDIGCVVEAEVHDNGRWTAPDPHNPPLNATLIYVPGALLEIPLNPTIHPDYSEVAPEGEFDFEGYYQLYERRLLPGLLHANAQAQKEDKQLLITIPGIGCGQFAGEFGENGNKSRNLYADFRRVLERILENHGTKLSHVKAIWYDSYQDSLTKKTIIKEINFHVRPLQNNRKQEIGKPQLCKPEEYDKEYANYHLVSFVAWDALSLPGNDYWKGSRATDDGVKGAASNTMTVLTGIPGEYHRATNKFLPKPNGTTSIDPKRTWKSVLKQPRAQNISVKDQIISYETQDFPSISNVQEGSSSGTTASNDMQYRHPKVLIVNRSQQKRLSQEINQLAADIKPEAGNLLINSPEPQAEASIEANISTVEDTTSVRTLKIKPDHKLIAFFKAAKNIVEKGKERIETKLGKFMN